MQPPTISLDQFANDPAIKDRWPITGAASKEVGMLMSAHLSRAQALMAGNGIPQEGDLGFDWGLVYSIVGMLVRIMLEKKGYQRDGRALDATGMVKISGKYISMDEIRKDIISLIDSVISAIRGENSTPEVIPDDVSKEGSEEASIPEEGREAPTEARTESDGQDSCEPGQ